LPARLLLLTATNDEIVPAWLGDHDRPWLRDLLTESAAFAGRPFATLAAHWRTTPRDPRAGPRLGIARHVLRRLLLRTANPPARTTLRQQLFAAAAALPRDAALAAVARRHGLDAGTLADDLFADLPHARRVVWPEPPPEPAWFARLANLSIAQSLLRHASAAELELDGASRAVLRTAWLHGAPFAIDAGPAVRLRWRTPGPGRLGGLAAIAPVLPWARRFELRAHCLVRGVAGTFVLSTGDPLLPGPEPRAFDSELERTFARDFAALAPDRPLHREPRPLVVAGRLCFPDFAIRGAGDDPWLLEIAGLRDRRALPHKLAALAEPRYLLCLPSRLVPPAFTDHPRVVPFARRVDANAVLARLTRP